jgi:hypothetical protein
MTATPFTARPRIVTGRAIVLGTAAALVLTACSGKGGSDSDEPELGALDKLFEQAWGEWDEDASNAKQMQVEELTAECMAREGFEYIPVDYSQNSTMIRIDGDDEIPWGTLEFAKQWGYGITTNPWEEQQEEPIIDEPIDEWYDPNQDIINAMTEQEQEAYWLALYGTGWSDMDENGEYVEPSWEDLGCNGWANHEVWGDNFLGGADDPYADLMEEMNRMWESIQSDERILAVESKWATCMADAGHPNLSKVGDAEQTIYDQVDPIWNEAYSDMPMDATEEDYRAVEKEIQAQLAAITPKEIELAVADYTCRKDVGYDDAYTEVNLAKQQEFYDTHKAELEEWVAYQQEQNS